VTPCASAGAGNASVAPAEATAPAAVLRLTGSP
jgi:hypothetical protein